MSLTTAVGVASLVLVTAASAVSPPTAGAQSAVFDTTVARYLRVLPFICDTGVTPEARRLYGEAVAAVDAARYGGGTDSNFWGLRDPDLAYLDCFQSPGRE